MGPDLCPKGGWVEPADLCTATLGYGVWGRVRKILCTSKKQPCKNSDMWWGPSPGPLERKTVKEDWIDPEKETLNYSTDK